MWFSLSSSLRLVLPRAHFYLLFITWSAGIRSSEYSVRLFRINVYWLLCSFLTSGLFDWISYSGDSPRRSSCVLYDVGLDDLCLVGGYLVVDFSSKITASSSVLQNDTSATAQAHVGTDCY